MIGSTLQWWEHWPEGEAGEHEHTYYPSFFFGQGERYQYAVCRCGDVLCLLPTYTRKGKPAMPKNDVPNSQAAFDTLNATDEELGGGWVQLDSILYQDITITSADVQDRWSEDQQKNRTVAVINFFYTDDVNQTSYAVSTGWPIVREQVARLKRDKAFPVACGFIEMIDKPQFNGRYPVRLVDPSRLPAAWDASISARQETQEAAGQEEPSEATHQPEPANAGPVSQQRSSSRSASTGMSASARTAYQPRKPGERAR